MHVFFTPSAIVRSNTGTDDVYIVVDVIRATTTLAVMFERGAARVLVTETVEEARKAAQHVPPRLLCGERNALPPPGFDYGNSPLQFSRLDLAGRELVLTTTNGTRAFYACPETAPRLAGSFYNGQAVALRALELARERQSDIAIVCAGELGYFALDDAACAGYLALELQRQYAEASAGEVPLAGIGPLYLHESVNAAIALYRAYRPPLLIEHCQSAQSVIQNGLPGDPPFCMQMSVSQSIPTVVGKDEETGLLVLERLPHPSPRART